MATKKTKDNFLTDSLKGELKTIITGILDKDKKLTIDDVESITITKTDNGFLVVQNNGTSTDLPTTEVLQAQDVDEGDEEQEFRDVTSELMYRIAEWAGVEFDEKRNDNLMIEWNGGGDGYGEEEYDSESDVDDENYVPPTKEQVIAAAMSANQQDEKGGNDDNDDYIPEFDDGQSDEYEDDGVRNEDELSDDEWVAGEDYSHDPSGDEPEWDDEGNPIEYDYDDSDEDYIDADE